MIIDLADKNVNKYRIMMNSILYNNPQTYKNIQS